jgi:transcription antitermination factor NusG
MDTTRGLFINGVNPQQLYPGVLPEIVDGPLPWFAVRTRSNFERITATALENKGLVPYLPTYRSRRRWSDRTVIAEKPMFQGYVFCRFDPLNRLPILTTTGVISIVGCGTEPAPIDDQEIEAIQAILRSGLATEPCPFLKEGQKIRITRGALEGIEGILTKKKSDFRLVISVTMLQRSIAVEIDHDWIEPIR